MLCKNGYKNVSWFLVLLPYCFILFGFLQTNEGFDTATAQSQKAPLPTTLQAVNTSLDKVNASKTNAYTASQKSDALYNKLSSPSAALPPTRNGVDVEYTQFTKLDDLSKNKPLKSSTEEDKSKFLQNMLNNLNIAVANKKIAQSNAYLANQSSVTIVNNKNLITQRTNEKNQFDNLAKKYENNIDNISGKITGALNALYNRTKTSLSLDTDENGYYRLLAKMN